MVKTREPLEDAEPPLEERQHLISKILNTTLIFKNHKTSSRNRDLKRVPAPPRTLTVNEAASLLIAHSFNKTARLKLPSKSALEKYAELSGRKHPFLQDLLARKLSSEFKSHTSLGRYSRNPPDGTRVLTLPRPSLASTHDVRD